MVEYLLEIQYFIFVNFHCLIFYFLEVGHSLYFIAMDVFFIVYLVLKVRVNRKPLVTAHILIFFHVSVWPWISSLVSLALPLRFTSTMIGSWASRNLVTASS